MGVNAETCLRTNSQLWHKKLWRGFELQAWWVNLGGTFGWKIKLRLEFVAQAVASGRGAGAVAEEVDFTATKHQASRAQLWCHSATTLPPQLCGATSSHDTIAPDQRPRYYGRAHHRAACIPRHSPHQSLLRRQLPLACYSATCGPRHAIPNALKKCAYFDHGDGYATIHEEDTRKKIQFPAWIFTTQLVHCTEIKLFLPEHTAILMI